MKKDKIVSDIKTVGVVATAALALHSCKKEPLTFARVQTALYKTDSAANMRPEYTTTTRALDLYEAQIQAYKTDNKNMLKLCCRDYLQYKIKNFELRRFLMSALENQTLMDFSDFDVDEANDVVSDMDAYYINKLRFFRRNQRWFNDALLYLCDKCDEMQFLKGDFFKTIKNPELKAKFAYNTQKISELNSVAAIASKRRDHIYDDMWQHYLKETKRQR